VAAIAFVDEDAFDLAAGELLGQGYDLLERVAVIAIARKRLGVEDELAARGACVGGDGRDFDTGLVRRPGFALADAFEPGAWKE
jgi:hypothetical protein